MYKPQEGRQSEFLSSDADIVIYGGAAGSGKTYALLLEPLRFFNKTNVNAAIFRRHHSDLGLPGAVWTESQKVYGSLGIHPNLTKMQYQFSEHSYLKFAGLQYDSDVYKWQGSQLDFIGFDELTQFTEYQFFYLIARLRSVSGKIIPYARATCNPEKGWVSELLEWWIDKDTGYPIPERCGKLRYLLRIDDVKYWFDSRESADFFIKTKKLHDKIAPLSITFIAATLNDNQELLKNDPTYYAKLAQLPDAEQQKLLYGRWWFKPAGKLFKAEWFKSFVIAPAHPDCILVTVDTASSTNTANDFTVFQLWMRQEGNVYLIDQIRGQMTATEQLRQLTNLILVNKVQYCAIELASTGFYLRDEIVKATGVIVIEIVRTKRVNEDKENKKPFRHGSSGDKYQRAYDIQAYVERGYVYVNPTADYYLPFIGEVCEFAPENKTKNARDDQVDPLVDCCQLLLKEKIGYNYDHGIKPSYMTENI